MKEGFESNGAGDGFDVGVEAHQQIRAEDGAADRAARQTRSQPRSSCRRN
jgi:hypothetical protein